jgi:hypothetical protein
MAAITEAPSPQALAALAVVASLMEALSRRGVIDSIAVDDTLRDAASYAQALCADCPAEVERGVQRLLMMIGEAKAQVADTEGSPVPVVDPGDAAR